MAAALGKLKNWFNRKNRSPRPVSLGPPPALLERYLQYKRLLAANSAILTIVADLQVKVSEGFLFDMHYVRQACDRLGREVETLVAALTAMSGGRYTALEEARRRVAQLVAEDLAVGIKLTPVPLVLPLKEVREGMFYGGKGEKLGELTRLGLLVPAGFGISAYAQKLFFEAAGLEAFIRREISHSHIRDLESLREAGEAIRERIMAQDLPEELAREIAAQLERLPSDRVAVRSSALQEDSQFSFAGQFETILNVPRERVVERYKEVIASQFTPRSLYYCHTSGFSYQELAMGVVVMEMVAAQTAGVLYTDDPRGGGATIINAVCGLGSLAVGGAVEPDIFRVEADRILASHVGEKTRMHVPAPAGRHPGPGDPGGTPGAVPVGGTGPGPDRPGPHHQGTFRRTPGHRVGPGTGRLVLPPPGPAAAGQPPTAQRLSPSQNQRGPGAPGKRHRRLPGGGGGAGLSPQGRSPQGDSGGGGAGDQPGLTGVRPGGGAGRRRGFGGRQRHQPPGHGPQRGPAARGLRRQRRRRPAPGRRPGHGGRLLRQRLRRQGG